MKVMLSLCLTRQDAGEECGAGDGSTAKHILNFDTRRIFRTRLNPLVKSPRYLLPGGYALAQLVETLYMPEDRGFDSQWCHWD
jgi:hypothetical protein